MTDLYQVIRVSSVAFEEFKKGGEKPTATESIEAYVEWGADFVLSRERNPHNANIQVHRLTKAL
jgi:hypothetical protein